MTPDTLPASTEPARGSSGIEITEISIRLAQGSTGPIRAYVRLTLNDAFAVNGLRVVQGKSGLFVAYPREYSKKEEKGLKGFNVCFPVNREMSAYFTEEVLREYHAAVGDA